MQFALAHAALGDREQALQFFERALEEREPDMLWLAVDPRVDEAARSSRACSKSWQNWAFPVRKSVPFA